MAINTTATINEAIEAARPMLASGAARMHAQGFVIGLDFLWMTLDKPTKAAINKRLSRMGISVESGNGDAAAIRFAGFIRDCVNGIHVEFATPKGFRFTPELPRFALVAKPRPMAQTRMF